MCLSCRLRILLGGDGGSLCVLSYLILPTPYKAGLLLCPFYRWHLGSEWATEGYTASKWVEFTPSVISGLTIIMCQILKDSKTRSWIGYSR